MRRSKQAPSPCAIGGLLELLTRPWTLHILWSLSTNGPMRFGVLRKNVAGISSRKLSERLRTLEEKGFVFQIGKGECWEGVEVQTCALPISQHERANAVRCAAEECGRDLFAGAEGAATHAGGERLRVPPLRAADYATQY